MRTCYWSAFLALLLSAAPAFAEPETSVAVLDFDAKSGVSQAQADALNDLVASAILSLGSFKVIAKADILALLSVEEQRVQLTGCADDACLAEIGGALGVSLLVSGNLAQFGDVFLINLRLVDANKAEAVGRSSREITGGQSELPAAVRAAVKELFRPLVGEQEPAAPAASDGAAATPGAAAPDSGEAADATVVRHAEQPSGFRVVAPWLALGLTGAAAVAGGVVFGLGMKDYSSMDDEFKGSDRWSDLGDSGDTKLIAGEALFGVALAAGVATVVLFLTGGEDEAPAAAVLPLRGGAAASVSWSFDPGVRR